MATEKFPLMKVELANQCLPIFDYVNNKEWVKFGVNNNYFEYLIDLYNRNAIHGAIVKGKASYLFGKGLKFADSENVLQTAKSSQWLQFANRYETWNDIYKKMCKYWSLNRGFALQVIWNYAGSIAEIYVLEIGKLRRSKDGKKVYYCDRWTIDNNGVLQPNPNPERDRSWKVMDIFNPNIRTGTQVLYFHEPEPSTQEYGHLYPIPEYAQANAEIETYIEIVMFHFYHMKNGMFASAILALFNGYPTPEEEKKIKKMFNYTHTGTINTGKLIFSFNDKGGTPPSLTKLTGDDLEKMFEQRQKMLREDIFSAHASHPVLFGVMTEGSLSDTSGEAVLKKWKQFNRTWVEPNQQTIIDLIKSLEPYYNGVSLEGLEVIPYPPVDEELPSDPNIHALFDKADLQKYYAKKYGIEVTTPAQPVTGAPIAQESQVNENLKRLSGRDWQHIKRIIREVQNGKTTRETGAMMLKNGYALTDADINVLFATPENQFKKFDIEKRDRTEELLQLFEKHAISDNEDFVIEEFEVHGEKDALRAELKSQKFEDVSPEIQNSILDLLKGDPFATPEKIARQLGIDPRVILIALTALIASGYIVQASGAYQPTEKGINKVTDKVQTEVYTVYKYETRKDVPRTLHGSRPFCKRMLELSNEGKRWTRDAIENISNEFGEDAWIYRGGFYTNPDTDETTSYCRHIFKGIIKSRTKK